MSSYNEQIAADILNAIRDGKLISTACAQVGLDRKDFYSWLRDKSAKVGDKPLSEAFADADEDRRMTWRESALFLINQLDEDSPPNEVTVARAKAQMFMQMAKESSLEVFARSIQTDVNGAVPMVVIRRFMPLAVDEEVN